MAYVDPEWDPEDVKEVPDGSGDAPHPMGPHGDHDERYHEPLEGDVVLEDGEVMDSDG